MDIGVRELALFYKHLCERFKDSCKDWHCHVNTFNRIRDLRKHGVDITYKLMPPECDFSRVFYGSDEIVIWFNLEVTCLYEKIGVQKKDFYLERLLTSDELDNRKLFGIMYGLHKSLDSFIFSVEKKLKRRFNIETPYLTMLKIHKKQRAREQKLAKKGMV